MLRWTINPVCVFTSLDSRLAKIMRFLLIKNASIESRLHYLFDVLSTVSTKTFENVRIASDVSWSLCARLQTHAGDISFWSAFDPFRPSASNTICMRFRFYSLHKRLQIDAFSKETLSVLVWTESLNATKCMRGHLFWSRHCNIIVLQEQQYCNFRARGAVFKVWGPTHHLLKCSWGGGGWGACTCRVMDFRGPSNGAFISHTSPWSQPFPE